MAESTRWMVLRRAFAPAAVIRDYPSTSRHSSAARFAVTIPEDP